MNRLQHLEDAGVSIWLDDLSRELIESGEFMRLVQEQAGNRRHLEPDHLRQGDQWLRALRPPAASRARIRPG